MKKFFIAIFFAFSLLVYPAFAEKVDSSNYSKMIEFTISGYKGSTTLNNFPLLVRFSANNPVGFNYKDIGLTKEDVYKNLCFTDGEDNSLNYEIDTWNPEGESLIWVSVPTVLSGKVVIIKSFYGLNEDSVNVANTPAAVWSAADYVAVWHMNEVSEDGASVFDATGNGFTATAKTSYANPTLSTEVAMFGNAVKGTTSGGLFLPQGAFSCYNTEEDRMQDHYSVEGWINRNGSGSNNIIFSSGLLWESGAQIGLQGYLYGNNHHNAKNDIIPKNGWVFIGATWASKGNAAYLYCGSDDYENGEGVFLFKGLNRTDISTDFTSFSINSYASNNNGGEAFGGYMDELRVRRVASSQDWADAVYASGKENSTFLESSFVATLNTGIEGFPGKVEALTTTTVTIIGSFLASNPEECTVTYTLKMGDEVVASEVSLGTLNESALAYVELDDLLPGTTYDFIFNVKFNDVDAYSIGGFTTESLSKPVISNVGDNTATAKLTANIVGENYAAGTCEAVFSTLGFGEDIVTPLSYVDGVWVAVATTLEEDMDYAVRFVFKPVGMPVVETPFSDPITTTGLATISPSLFGMRMELTVSGYDGTETLTNFPVLVRIPSSVASTVKDVKEIRFIWENNLLLAYDLEVWNPEGESLIWVSVPYISGQDTSFMMGWNLRPGFKQRSAHAAKRVWQKANYVGVWHFGTQNEDGSFPDASGNNATAIPLTSKVNPGTIETEGTSANGTPWHFVKGGVRVSATDTADWLFAETGYTTEAWLIPSGDFNRMFLYSNSNNGGNALALGKSSVYVMNNNYENTLWSAEVRNQQIWRFTTTSWRYSGAPEGSATIFYENAKPLASWSYKNAVSFTDNGMGLTSGTEGNGVLNYPVDELRVRRGMSSVDWVQANYDTQKVGSDFLSLGEVVKIPFGTTIIVR
ncbi:MAG: hypothetical protein J6V41_02945 [Kiritimatiellae bacterium]|nr:hypothetical protein [Kiritimatiellia bacterium]